MDKFIDRESSALEFNVRVLGEATDPSNPLLERLKFLGIVSSNVDEFFMVRVASLKAAQTNVAPLYAKAFALMEKRNAYLLNTFIPEMEAAGFNRLQMETCNAQQGEFLGHYFHREILPVLTPIALSNDLPFPVLANLRLHMVVGLAAAGSNDRKYAVIEIPHKGFPRMIFVPSEKGHPFMLIEDLVAFFAAELFPGYEIVEKGMMRLTRGAELSWDEEKDEDFMRVMTEALRERREGEIVRLEVSAQQPWAAFLQKRMGIDPAEMVVNSALLDLKTISQLAFQPGFDSLKRPAWEPRAVPEFELADDIWTLLRERNVLLFHPYESFSAVVNFLEAAADDPNVMAIKQTLYRTDSDSPILKALERAAEKGKRVTAIIELKARFDEENNIEWARRLRSAGASVLYGVAGYKTHAKACLVIRRERDGIRRYVHLSTGNYNAKTSRVYSDIGYLTSDEALANDLSGFFNMITGYSQKAAWRKIEVAPYGLRKKLLRLIVRETMRSTADKPGLIRAKMNSLADPEIIEALYKASGAGVRVQLNVRGICCLRPGVKGLSETIQVVSIVDQFLEHSRVFYFANGGQEEVYLSSADWMPRNLDRRVELLFPVDEAAQQKRLIEVLDFYFKDNVKSWQLMPDGTYHRIDNAGRRKFRAQETLCQRATDAEKNAERGGPEELRPQKPRGDASPPTARLSP